ncbi:hypothetical protein AAG570_001872 [Ranatra chinensis]|uniref:mRNA (guanine-N(7))-methyltransferase n=1 Tax=Ranatra chinensis TaxID=642074 RepID=A0ABD0YNS3_9HEMI
MFQIKILRTQEEAGSNHGSIVAAHYSTAEHGLGARNESRIVYLRNFNNWIKGMLISEYLKELQCSGNRIHALDMCCGKGGDLLKWRIGGIKHLVCSDIAELAVENCKKRYDDMMTRKRDGNKLFSAEFIVCDLTKTRIRGKYEDPSMHFDIVSCQFAFHYSFESLPQAECMLRNAAECLKPGGYFIGTIPDANAIVHRYKQFKKRCFGNSVYSITFDDSLSDDNYPLFGAKYNFNLDGVVDCPEFLVHFPTLVK